jgi:hypothetical protein
MVWQRTIVLLCFCVVKSNHFFLLLVYHWCCCDLVPLELLTRIGTLNNTFVLIGLRVKKCWVKALGWGGILEIRPSSGPHFGMFHHKAQRLS